MIFKIQKKKINGEKTGRKQHGWINRSIQSFMLFFSVENGDFFLILAILLQFSPVLFFFFRLKTNTDYVVVFSVVVCSYQ